MRTNRLLFGLVLGALAVTLFAASLPMTRLAVAALDPWFVTTARGAGAGFAAAALLVALRRPIPWRDLPRLIMIALCLVIGFPLLMAIAMKTVPSAHGGVILGLLPMATAIAAVFLAGERPSPFFWTMSALGALLVVIFSLRDGGATPVAGDLYLFAAVAICGTGYALSGSLARRMPGWEVISWAVVVSLPLLLVATIALWPEAPASTPWESWAGLLYLALVSQYFGFFLWNSALAAGGVARIGQVQLLQPFATLAIAALMLGEAIDLRMVVFATAVVAVVALGLRARVAFHAPQIAPAATTAPADRVDRSSALSGKVGARPPEHSL
jgi:drug/metabolite transporter (DMT)-like permease